MIFLYLLLTTHVNCLKLCSTKVTNSDISFYDSTGCNTLLLPKKFASNLLDQMYVHIQLYDIVMVTNIANYQFSLKIPIQGKTQEETVTILMSLLRCFKLFLEET